MSPYSPSPLTATARYARCRPTVHSPLVPSSSVSISIPPPPGLVPPRRPRSRSTEVSLMKLALDPWLRLSRSLDSNCHPDFADPQSPSTRQASNVFNPATYPSAGNLRELRSYSPPADPFAFGMDFGLVGYQGVPEPSLTFHLPFTFDDNGDPILSPIDEKDIVDVINDPWARWGVGF